MRFCINLSSMSSIDLDLRLQRDNSWAPCSRFDRIGRNDFTTLATRVLMQLQRRELWLVVKGDIYLARPGGRIEVDYDHSLYFDLYGFRDHYPEPPARQQLEDLFFGARNLAHRQLTLKTDGRFYLDSLPPRPSGLSDPQIVLEFYRNGSGHEGIDSNKKDPLFHAHIDLLFRKAMRAWRDHLLYKSLHVLTPTTPSEFDVADLNDIYEDLVEIKEHKTYL